MALFHFPLLLISKKELETKISMQAMEACEHIISEMGAELHDDLIQKLSILRLHLDKIERSSYDPKETRESVTRMQNDFQIITESIRRISRQLHPVKMEEDSFDKMIETLCQTMNTPGSLRISSHSEGIVIKLSPKVETYLLRMIQELIHNALRHSSAWHVWVKLTWEPTRLQIEVEDDGSGFSKISEFVQKLKRKHNTLRMRAEAINATIKYRQGEKGLLAVITFPFS